MSRPDELVRRWFDEVWNAGSEEAIDRLLAADGRLHGLGADGEPIVGPAAFKPFFRQLKGAFPDLRVEVLQVVVEGDRVAAHCRVTGTHRGGQLGFPPTGRSVRFEGMCMVRCDRDTLGEAWNSFDFLSLYQQLGVVAQAPGAG